MLDIEKQLEAVAADIDFLGQAISGEVELSTGNTDKVTLKVLSNIFSCVKKISAEIELLDERLNDVRNKRHE